MPITTGSPPTREADLMDYTNSFWHSKRTLAAGLVLVAVAIGATWAALDHGTGHDHPATAAYDSACGLHGGSTATPTAGPEVQWQNIDGNWLPVSTTEGPGTTGPTGARSCFAHTPTGAVLAALTIPGAMNVAKDFVAVVKQQTTSGSGQAAALQQGQPHYSPNESATPLGFRINSYDASGATVTFYVRQRGVTARCSSSVQWTGGSKGDWLLVLASDGSSVSGCERTADVLPTDGVVAWGPNP